MRPRPSDYNKGLIYTDTKGCVDCSKCIHECPVLASNVSVMGSDSKYSMCVDEKECILCGTCLDICVHGARHFRDDCGEFLSALKRGEELSVLIAPAFYLNYPDEYKNVLGYLKSLGVKDFYPVAFGADIATWGYIKYEEKNNTKGMVSQPCPCIVSYIENHMPELLPNIIPIQSPMMCTAIYLKKYLGIKEKLAFLSPCIAKKVEIQSKRGLELISHNVTFKNLMAHIEQQGVSLSDYCEGGESFGYGMGSLFPMPGGFGENIAYYLGPAAAIVQVEGEQRVYKYLEYFSDFTKKLNGKMPTMVEALNCQKGCSFGTGTDVRCIDENSVVLETIAMRTDKYYAMKGEDGQVLHDPAGRSARLGEIFKDLKLEDFMCEYENAHNSNTVTDAEIEAIFSESLEKLTDNDKHMDCSACGYKTCRQMAEAIALGINYRDNCVYYVKNTLAKSVEEVYAAEERLRNIFDNMPVVINFRDKSNKVVGCNDEAANLFGLNNKTEYIEKFDELLPPFQPDGSLTWEKLNAKIENAWKTGRSHFELVYKHVSGEAIPCEVVLIRIMLQGENHVVAFIRDMRMFYKAQEDSRIMEQRLKTMLDASPLLCAIFDESYYPTEVNEEVTRLLKISSKQLYLNNFNDMIPERQPCGMLSSEKASIELSRAFKEGKSYIAEWVYKTSDGELVPFEVFLECVRLEGKNVVMTYARDLRPVKAAVKLTIEANEMFKMFLGASPTLMEVWDEKFRLIECNKRVLEHFGVGSVKEYFEQYYDFQPVFQPCGTPSRKKNIALLKEAFAEGRAHAEIMHVSSKGEPLPVEAHLVRLVRHGKNVVVRYEHDLRNIKSAMEKLQKEEAQRESIEAENQAKTRFLAQMSHEIRTPLNAVLGVTEIQLMREDIFADTRDAFQRIKRSSNLLLSIINDILDHSKIAAGKMEMVSESYDVLSLIVDTVQLCSVYTYDKNIEFNLSVDESLPAYMIGDELRIKQIMNNILSNAFKYTDRGAVTLSISVEEASEPECVVLVIGVSDTGLGMTDEQISNLFDEFTRYDLQRNRYIEGTGLGMPITYMLTKLMQGELEVESGLDKGSTFTARIPQRLDGVQTLGKETADELNTFKKFQKHSKAAGTFVREPMPYGKVLVVDDVESNRYVARGLLQAYKLTVETVDSGYRAIDKIVGGEIYDIIFMDHMMPDLDGVKTTEIIRERGYKHPVVALTANAIKGQDKFFQDLGFSGFISKPIDTKQLNDCLVRLIRDKQPPEVVEAARDEHGMLSGEGQVDWQVLSESFLRDAKKVALILESVVGQGGSGTDAVEMYTVQAHGIKTALRNIGKLELSEVAYALEQAGENADLETIRDMTPSFLDSLRDVIKELESKLKRGADDGDDDDTAFLHKQLLIIAHACEEFDLNEANSALLRLEQSPGSKKTKELLREIKSCLLRGDFEGAVALIKQYIGELAGKLR